MKLIIHLPSVKDGQILATYQADGIDYSHTFSFSEPVLAFDKVSEHLIRWLAIAHAPYLFSNEYYTEIETDFTLSSEEISFFEKLVYNGMAEFRYVNNIPIATRTTLRPKKELMPSSLSVERELNGRLLLNGGGKDGLTSGLLLQASELDFTLFQIGSGVAQNKTAGVLNSPMVLFKREMDEKRLTGKFQGHRPTSAAIAISALLTAYMTGKRDVIASNENSANEPNLEVDGVEINHQYSKSYEFEKDLSELLVLFGLPLRYFSLLRPFHELQIVKLFTHQPTDASNSFISCNHGFRKGFWCKTCAKCAFISLAFTAVAPETTESIFGVENSITIPELERHIIELVSPELQKPLECVGTLYECQLAAKLILDRSPDLLSSTLHNIFSEKTRLIQEGALDEFMSTFNTMHNIPAIEYAAVFKLTGNILHSNLTS
jgi:hypothetical protein